MRFKLTQRLHIIPQNSTIPSGSFSGRLCNIWILYGSNLCFFKYFATVDFETPTISEIPFVDVVGPFITDVRISFFSKNSYLSCFEDQLVYVLATDEAIWRTFV